MSTSAIFIRVALAAACVAVAAPVAEAASPVRLEGVDGDVRRELRALLPDRDRPASAFDAERLSEEAARLVRDWLRSEGYYAGRAEPAASDAPPRAAVRITLGPRYRFLAPEVAFDATPAPEAARAVAAALAPVAPGAPGRAADVLSAEAAAADALRGAGYPDAVALPRRAVVDHAAQTLAVAFAFQPGARARLGPLVATPPDIVLPRVLARLQTWSPGDYYAPEALSELRETLAGSGAFASASVTLAPEADADGRRPVEVTLAPGPPRSIALGAAYSTLEGAGVDASFAIRNQFRRLETATVSARVAEFERTLGFNVRFPNALGPGRARSYQIEIADQNLDPFERQGVRIATAVESRRRRGMALSYGVSLAADRFETAAGGQDATTAAAFGEARLDQADDPLNPRRGGLLSLRLEPGYATGDADVAFLRAVAEARRYASFGADDRATLAVRARTGWVAALSGSEEALPVDRRFYAGGGGSVRGYGFNAIFPDRRRALAEPPGGQGLLEVAFEARTRVFGPWGIAAFADAGSSFDEVEDATDLRWGAGLGVRYDLGFAPLRIDVATPLNGRDSDPPVAFYVSLGQAF